MAREAFGIELAKALGAPAPSAIVTRARRSAIEVSRVRRRASSHDRSETLPGEDAFLLTVHLGDCEERELWLDDRPAKSGPVSAGAFTAIDLRRRPSWRANSAVDAIVLHIPRAAMDSLTTSAGLPTIGELVGEPGCGVIDPSIRDLVTLLVPALASPAEASQLFLDNVILAICARLAQAYGDRTPIQSLYKGGLAAWQERKAKEMLSASLTGAIRISDLANECGLSTSQFSRSFRQSTGLAPHQWLVGRRVELAKELLTRERMPLSEISLACGFADQSHFTRVFSRQGGVSPGAWRRNYL